MRLTLTLQRDHGEPVDLAVTADATVTVGQLAQVLVARDPDRRVNLLAPTLELDRQPLNPQETVADSRLQSGASVRLAEAVPTQRGPAEQLRAQLVVVSGPAAGDGPFPLRAGVSTIGRDLGQTVRLRDARISRRHAKLRVGAYVEIEDLNSANGVEVNGERVERARLRSEDLVVLGDTTIRVVYGGAATPDPEGNGELFNRSPRLEARYAGEEFEAPDPPAPPARQPMSWTPLLAPLLLGPALYAVTGRAATLLFLLLSPLLMLGSLVERRHTARRDHREAVRRHREALQVLQEQLAVARGREEEARRAEHPAISQLVDAALTRAPLLWSARPDRPGFLEVRLGLGRAAARNKVVLPHRRAADAELWQELLDLRESAATVDDVPIVAELCTVGAVGVAAERASAVAAMRALIAQLACRHSPAELVLAAAVPAGTV